MRRPAFTLVEIMIVIAIIALLAAIAIPNLLRAKINENDNKAQEVLREIATACESFAQANNGNYPIAITDVTQASPGYLNDNYCDGVTRNGYVFGCALTASGYTFTARPAGIACGNTGTKSWQMTTGAVLTQDATCMASGS